MEGVLRRGVAIGISGLTAAAIAVVVVFDRLLVAAGRPDLGLFGVDDLPYVAATVSAAGVGVVLAFRRPEHPVGWLFLLLGFSFPLSGVFDGYGVYGAVARPGSLPAAELAQVLGEASFIPWFVLLALILQLTPDGRPLWRWAAWGTVAAGTLWYLIVLLWSVVPGLAAPRTVFGVLTALGLVVAGFSLLVRFRRSRGVERRRLLWLAVAVVPLPAFVVVAFYASPDHPALLSIATSGFILLIPLAAGLSIAQYHLYDVERILSRAVAYLLVSGVLVFTFVAVVITAGRLTGGSGESHVPAVLGTLAAVALAGPVYRAFQEAVDRRFNRRRFDTLRMIRAYVRSPESQDVQSVLREALGDPGLRTAYWVDDRKQWVTATGQAVLPDPQELPVLRGERQVARIFVSPGVDRELAQAAANEALPELENAGLRAAISLQLVEVRESRARIAAAQLSERRRIERDLHDGAQQRLLALALNLRAAQLNGRALDEAVELAIIELQSAVGDLRALANGLLPSALVDAGLAVAVEDLALRLPLEVRVEVTDQRFSPQVEATAWFIVCEAVTNAVKHADASLLEISAQLEPGGAGPAPPPDLPDPHDPAAPAGAAGWTGQRAVDQPALGRRLVVRVEDDGAGGADAGGTGLRGIADRAEAVGGWLTVEDRAGGGTRVTGELPCEC